jgi:peptide/nickel transport system substrate-binding protein
MVYNEPPHLNPALITGPPTGLPALQIFAGLLQFDKNYQPKPYLAKKWEISQDGCRYTFHLEKGATFHDGKPITSADVAFSLEMIQKKHPFGELTFGPVKEVETPDSQTIIFKLRHPSPVTFAATHPWLLPIFPKHIYSEGEIRMHPANVKPTVGSGPFKFVEWKKGQYIILERYENFFRKGRPYLDRIIIEFIPDPTARTIALETGAIHMAPLGYFPFSDARHLGKIPHLSMITKGLEGLGSRWVYELNLRKAPLDHVKVRKAIAHCFDWNLEIGLWHGFARAANAPLRYSSPFFNPHVQKYEYNLKKAGRLLDEAGYKRKADGTRFDLRIDFWPGMSAGPELLKEQLKKIGVRATLRPPADYASWIAKIANWDFEINSTGYFDFIDPTIGMDRRFTSRNIKKIPWTNTMGYSNPEVDRLCHEARKELGFEKRKKIYHRVQGILADELPVIYTADIEMFTLSNREFDGIPTDVWGMLNPLDTVFWKKGKTGTGWK